MSKEFKPSGKKADRRVAYRIYEQANLFYQRIEQRPPREAASHFDDMLNHVSGSQSPEKHASTVQPSPVDRSLPNSQSLENDTLQVNISTSGIAFTCKEELNPGDYLMLRILLLSSMTAIMTCCKVVYCKPSNPYETDRYPYTVGAYFVNLTTEDRALLNRHVNRRKKQIFIINGLLLAFVAGALAAPNLVFSMLWQFAHYAFVLFLHTLYLAFEYFELGLDHLVEHSLHASPRTAQLIVFYILLALGFTGLYVLWIVVPAFCKRFVNNLLLFYSRKKSSFLYYWGQQALLEKVEIIGISLVAITGYVYFTLFMG